MGMHIGNLYHDPFLHKIGHFLIKELKLVFYQEMSDFMEKWIMIKVANMHSPENSLAEVHLITSANRASNSVLKEKRMRKRKVKNIHLRVRRHYDGGVITL